MKKLFISCPMKGRTEKNIRETFDYLHKVAEAVFDEELEDIDTYIEDDAPETAREAVWYLGKSIQMMSEADYFIGIYDEQRAFNGCVIENQVAKFYGIPQYLVNLSFAAPDVAYKRMH